MTVIGTGAGLANPVMIASQYGSGHIVASAESIGYAISTFGSNGNPRFCPPGLAGLAPSEDLKAASNIVSWGGEHTSFHKDARHTGYSYDEVGAPLSLKWNFDMPSAKLPTGSSPAILNDMVFYVDAGGFLHAFDLSPAQDLPMRSSSGAYVQDGDPDDYVASDPPAKQLRDYSQGTAWDEVWMFPCDSPASSPTVAYVTIGKGKAIPAVFVATMSGKILAFEATTGAPLTGGTPLIMTVNPYPQDEPGKINIPAPTYFDGVVYVGDGMGWLQCNDLLGGSLWRWPYSPIPNLPPTLNSPTVGYFRNPITGSVDQLVYLASRGKPNSANGCIYSFPIKVFNEVLTAAPGGVNRYRIRKYSQMPIKEPASAGDPPTYQLYITLPNGGLQPVAATVCAPPDIGTFQVATPVPIGSSVIADYEIDTSGIGTPIPPPMYRQRIDVKNQIVTAGAPTGAGVTSTPAAAPSDALYYGTENGSFYSVIEDGWGITTKWRWYLGDPGPMNLIGGQATIVGSPAVGNDMVYYAVNSGSGGCILAFHADPVFRISVGGPIDSRRPVEVLQYDSMNPGRDPIAVSGAAEGTDTSRRRVAFKIDYDKGRITMENFLDPLSSSQDLVVRFFPPTESGPGTRVEQIHQAFPPPSGYQFTDDSWNNLAWYMKIPEGAITSSPMLMGSTLYFGVGANDGRLHAIDVQYIAENTADGQPAPADPDSYRWIWPDPNPPAPQVAQPGLGGPILSTVAGSHGNIAISSPEGLAVLCNGLTLVADSRRVLEMDVAGRVVWSCDGTTSYTGTRLQGPPTPTPAYAATKIAFNKPAVARRIGTSNILVADTGNNRVVLIDRAGNALVEITGFLDPDVDPVTLQPRIPILPPGSPLEYKLNAPTDVWMKAVMDPTSGTMAYRFLITDSGNYRVIEVDSVFNSAIGRYGPPILRWSSRTLQQGKRYHYISARQYFNPEDGYDEVICVVDNLVPESSRLETSGGAIVTLDHMYLPVGASPSDPAYLGGLIRPNGVRRFADRSDGRPVDPKTEPTPTVRLINPTFFTRVSKSKTTFTDIIGDANGLHCMQFDVGSPTPVDSASYLVAQHPRPIQVSYAQLLPSGNLLVTSKASSLGSQTKGEIFELNSDLTMVLRSYNRLQIGRRQISAGQDQYSLLEQPASAERLLQ